MPQMSPLNWLFLYMFMFMILMMVILILSYFILPEKNMMFKLNKNYKNNYNWMW